MELLYHPRSHHAFGGFTGLLSLSYVLLALGGMGVALGIKKWSEVGRSSEAVLDKPP
jgi:hypothetical protein